jgi:hypothetical protein
MRADGASYAVIIAIFSRPLADTKAGTPTGEVSERGRLGMFAPCLSVDVPEERITAEKGADEL